MKYEHKGIEINFESATAVFRAKVGGEPLKAPSLTAIKKQIDEALNTRSTFKPFKAIDFSTYSDEAGIVPMEVVDLRKRDGRINYGSEFQFVTKTMSRGYEQNGTKNMVIVDTPQNRKAVQSYIDLYKRNEKEMERLKKEHEAARVALPYLKADDVALGKAKP